MGRRIFRNLLAGRARVHEIRVIVFWKSWRAPASHWSQNGNEDQPGGNGARGRENGEPVERSLRESLPHARKVPDVRRESAHSVPAGQIQRELLLRRRAGSDERRDRV